MTEVYIIGVAQFNTQRLNRVSPPLSQFKLLSNLVDEALSDAGSKLQRTDLNGLISMHPGYLDDSMTDFKSYTYYSQILATKLNLYKPYNKPFITKTCSSGGATPVAQCLMAKYIMNNNNNINCIATMVMQTPNSVDRKTLIGLRNTYFDSQLNELNIKHKKNMIAIPALYNAHTERFLTKYGKQYGIKRKHFAMVPVLMHRNGYHNKDSLSYKVGKLLNSTTDTILNSKDVGCSCIKQYECARLSDGGFCLIIANKKFILKNKININRCFKILGGAENDQSFKHMPYLQSMDPISSYSMYHSIRQCYINSNCTVNDINWFGVYDCYPISFILGMLCMGICRIENIALFLEKWYENKSQYNINTHGGLLSFGAPTCVPSGYAIIEAIKQMRNESTKETQIKFKINGNNKLKALIFGNGGMLQQSSAMIIQKGGQKDIISKL